MTRVTPRRAAANRANARHSTGPRSAAGKSRSRGNALKHGLAVPASMIPELAPEIAQLARTIAGPAADDLIVYQAALRVAEAAMDVMRARRARVALMDRITNDLDCLTSPTTVQPMPVRPAGVRISTRDYMQAYRNGTHRELRALALSQIRQEVHFDAEVARVKQQRAQAQHCASIWEQLDKLERYLRRALSRQNKAIRALDASLAAAAER